jgi:hypothetical protein
MVEKEAAMMRKADRHREGKRAIKMFALVPSISL